MYHRARKKWQKRVAMPGLVWMEKSDASCGLTGETVKGKFKDKGSLFAFIQQLCTSIYWRSANSHKHRSKIEGWERDIDKMFCNEQS